MFPISAVVSSSRSLFPRISRSNLDANNVSHVIEVLIYQKTHIQPLRLPEMIFRSASHRLRIPAPAFSSRLSVPGLVCKLHLGHNGSQS